MSKFTIEPMFDENGEPQKSPMETLKERMLSPKPNDEGKADAENPGFTVSKPEEEEASSLTRIELPDEELTDEPAVSEQEIPAEESPEEEPQAEAEPEDKTEAEPEEEIKEPQKKRPSFLKRIKRYTTDDNGVDVAENSEPLYELDSVNSILGIEEPEEEMQEDAPAEAAEQAEAPEEENKHYISDIDKSEFSPVPENPPTSDTATIRFTPISDGAKNRTTVSVDTMTHRIDLSDEITETAPGEEQDEESLAESEFEKFTPKFEITDKKSEKRQLIKFAVKKRNRFLASVLSGVIAFVLLIFLLPPIANSMLQNSKGMMIASTVLLGIMILANADMFLNFAKIRSKNISSDISASLLSLSTVLLAVFSIIKKEDTYPSIFICAFILFIRSLMAYYEASNKCDNLRIISVNRPKKAVTLISDKATTAAMAKNSIEGSALIVSARPTERIADFMKYTEYDRRMFGKAGTVTVISVALSVICGVTSGLIKRNVVEAFYISSVILSMTAIPIAFFVDTLPLRSMVSRLTRRGAMLTGFTAAEKVNTANAVVLRTTDLFPSGTVTLKDMKVLSDSNVDDIILRCASLTEALASPLSTIFKKIAKTNAAYDVPDSDTVKYEERLGISGWVNNERLFVGNRTLMEAHGIEVPPLEVDRAITKSGYFPVYVSKDNKACVLLVVKYSVDSEVAKQMREATDLGITLLIDNSDPNISSGMICDYFGLSEDFVYVMTTVGSNMHKTATAPMNECSAGAAYRGNSLSLLQIMTSAAKLKKSNIILTVIYCIAAIFGIVYFVYNSFLSGATLIERASAVLIYEIAATAISLLAFLIKRP